LVLGVLLTCAAFAFAGRPSVQKNHYDQHGEDEHYDFDHEVDPDPEEHQPPPTCTGCVTPADLTHVLKDYLKKTELVSHFATKIHDILADHTVKTALINFIKANPPACPTCHSGAVTPTPGLLLCQIQSTAVSAITSSHTISHWKHVYCSSGFKTLNTQGEFINGGTAPREVVLDIALRCGCKAPTATVRKYVVRRKRETMSPYDQSASAAVESTVYDPVDFFRAKRTVYTCGNDNCVGRTATVEIFKGNQGNLHEIREIQVSNLCHVVQSFRIVTHVKSHEKVILKLKDKHLLPTDRCIWTISAAYVG